MKRVGLSLAGVAMALVPAAAMAHSGAGQINGFSSGLLHPLGGLDHLLAMVTVGFWAAQMGGRAVWLVPAAFVAAMTAGGAVAFAGIGLPWVEVAIAASVLVLGALVAFNVRIITVAAMAIVATFAVFHGHAHGTELPAAASALGYAGGFMLATAALHAVGVGVGFITAGARSPAVARLGGAAVGLAGVALLLG